MILLHVGIAGLLVFLPRVHGAETPSLVTNVPVALGKPSVTNTPVASAMSVPTNAPSNAVDAELARVFDKLSPETNAHPTGLNPVLLGAGDKLSSTNLVPVPETTVSPSQKFQVKLDLGRKFRREKNWAQAETNLVFVLESPAPDEMKRIALLELAFVAQDSLKFTRAQQIFAQYLKLYPQDPSVPEILLRQGLLYRQMGANVLALSKFYAVMSASLNLKLDQLDYYQRLVLQAQTEIADTYYLQAKYDEASDYLLRLLKLENPELNKSQILYKLVRSLYYQERYTESAAQANFFLTNYAASPELPEVRFLLADALKRLGRTREAMQQVLLLLQAQQEAAQRNPENWIYWQQRTGNEIANQLYKEGDYVNALEIYLNLAPLDASAAWQLPVWYQIGLIYEKLQQPLKAAETYSRILGREKELLSGGAPSPGLQTVLDIARWRNGQLGWQVKAERSRAQLGSIPMPETGNNSTNQ